MLLVAAALIFLTGCAHSYLGERYILVRLFKHGSLPRLFGGTEFTEGTLRFAWHITTVAWWAIALLLVFAYRGTLTTPSFLYVIAGAAVASAALPLVFTRGKHLSWVAFLLVAALAFLAAQGASIALARAQTNAAFRPQQEIPMLPQILISTSAAIMLIIGTVHLCATFFGPLLRPRDPLLEAQMKQVSPVVTNQITMWHGWIAFNANQSLGLVLFGVLYSYLSIFQFQMLLQAKFLLFVGAVFLVGALVVAKYYLFVRPVRAFGISFVLYVVGTAVAVA